MGGSDPVGESVRFPARPTRSTSSAATNHQDRRSSLPPSSSITAHRAPQSHTIATKTPSIRPHSLTTPRILQPLAPMNMNEMRRRVVFGWMSVASIRTVRPLHFSQGNERI